MKSKKQQKEEIRKFASVAEASLMLSQKTYTGTAPPAHLRKKNEKGKKQ